MRKLLPILSLTLFLLGLCATTTWAQEASGDTSASDELTFIISPPRIELKGKPGETLQTSIKITNTATTSQTYAVSALDFVVDKDGKTPIPVAEHVSGRWSAASWMQFSNHELEIAPKKSGVVDVVVAIPQDALPGGHYAMLIEQQKQEQLTKDQGGSAASIIPRVGSLVYITVTGDIHEEAFIRRFTIPDWVEFGPMEMSLEVENLSDIHITPQPVIEIRNLFGRVVDTIKIAPMNIFPFTARSFSAEFRQIWGFGPYTAHLTVPYGNNGKVLTASRVFWMIPYRIILAILVILLSLLAVLIAIRRHIMHRNNLENHRVEVLEERIKELEHRVHEP